MSLKDTLNDGIRWITGTQSCIRRAVDTIRGHQNIRIVYANNDGGVLTMPWEGKQYTVTILSKDDQMATVSVQSQIRFPPGRLPQNACKALDELNQRLDKCYYDALHCETCSIFVVRTRVIVAEISPSAFVKWFTVLIEPVKLLDRLLQKYGCTPAIEGT